MKIAYYTCGGAVDMETGEDVPDTCPKNGCGGALDHVEQWGA